MNHLKDFLKDHSHILITDIGSTTTKSLLLEKDLLKGTFFFRDQCDAYTTVEKPFEDVRMGIMTAVATIADRTGLKLIDENDNFTVPYITTSSAGGGLQMLVFGLTAVATGKTAKQTCYGAGGVILQTFTIDDKLDDLEKMKMIRELHPDMILMAGGFEGGSEWGVLRQAQMLVLSEPTPKFKQSDKIPLIYCGNENTRHLLKDMLDNPFDLHFSPNIRPGIDEYNTEPTKEKIHKLFKENVMERAPGYSELMKMVSTDILATPTGVERTLELYAKKIRKNMIVVDMGGATTDIYTYINEVFHRTVAANIGLSYSISNILATVMEVGGIKRVMQHLPPDYTEKEIRNYISNKTVYPQYLPLHPSENRIEQAFTAEGFDIAWKQHVEMNFKPRELAIWEKTNIIDGFFQKLDHLKKQSHLNYAEYVYNVGAEREFQMSDVEVLLGSGGVIAYATSIEEQIFMLLEGFKPSGITKLLVDEPFKISHMGVLSTLNPQMALELFENECVKELAYVVAPVGKIQAQKDVLFVKDQSTQKTYLLRGGEFMYFKDGGSFVFETAGRGIYLNQKRILETITTELPVLIDCRGRESSFIDNPLMESTFKNSVPVPGQHVTKIPLKDINVCDLKEEQLIYTRSLPYKGDLMVAVDDKVSSDMSIGRNKFKPPRLYIIDVRRFGGYDIASKKEDILKGMMVEVGDNVEEGEFLFNGKLDAPTAGNMKQKGVFSLFKSFSSKGNISEHMYPSPVRGKVISMFDSGVIILEEIQDYDGRPIVVNLTERLLMNPKNALRRFRFNKGDFVRKDTVLAEIFGSNIKLVKSPINGFVKEIDAKSGCVTIQYDMKPLETKAYLSGRVISSDKENKVTIEGRGYRLQGVIGFGGECVGKLSIVTDISGLKEEHRERIVLVQNALDEPFLKKAAELGIKGIIAPSMDNDEWIKFYGKEMGVALTGDEDIPFSIVLMMGFGKYLITDDIINFFNTYRDAFISINGRTQIRAGITRPEIVISVD